MVMRQDGSRLHAVLSGVYVESSARKQRQEWLWFLEDKTPVGPQDNRI